MRNGEKTYLRLDLDDIYQEFMIMVFQFLSPVKYEAGKILYTELDDINNIHFITYGSYDTGYTINKNNHWKIRRFKGSVIGMYEVTHRLRIRNNIKVKEAIEGLFIRKKDMRKIELSFGQMYRYIKMNSFFDYILLRSKLNKCKEADL